MGAVSRFSALFSHSFSRNGCVFQSSIALVDLTKNDQQIQKFLRRGNKDVQSSCVCSQICLRSMNMSDCRALEILFQYSFFGGLLLYPIGSLVRCPLIL